MRRRRRRARRACRRASRRESPVQTRLGLAEVCSRRRRPARRRVVAARPVSRARSAAPARPGCHPIRSALRGTGSARPARLRGGRWSGVHGHDGGDAGVRSCNAVGQGENSRITPTACSRPAMCDLSNRSVAYGTDTMSRGSTARLRRGSSDGVGNGATRLVLCLNRLPARIPHAGSSERSYMGRGASSRLVPPSKTGHWSCRASMLGQSTLCAVGPTDTTSIANNLDSRNPHVRLRTSCPRSGHPSHPPVGSARAPTLRRA